MEGEETSVSVSSERGYYVLGQVVSQVEDLIHEFKGHCSISIHDIQNMSLPRSNSEKRTQNSVSISIAAMLNTGQGGTIYLGVTDSGRVNGLSLTRYQQDHIEMSLKWTLERYTPPVSDSRYCVIFVPVFSSKTLIPTHHVEQHLDNERRNRPHYVASSNSCWCDRDAWAQQSLKSTYDHGIPTTCRWPGIRKPHGHLPSLPSTSLRPIAATSGRVVINVNCASRM
ncbi:uncharacterized protein LOC121871938 isoform X2 [Homarus americanus]|uniref:uncharacterized protein LOC121871938 isoform X2 n=1 Tax=Homarus americanus TaxID=6706 RepID=UPI001C443567|nr:uncharacterized protein LOC121871938 isoform X2 [Homarus americanus]